MINIPLSTAPFIAGIIAFLVWGRHIEPPLPIWIILLVGGEALLFMILSFLAFHRVRVERDRARIKLSKKPRIPLQDRDKLVRAIYGAKTTASEFIDYKRQLAKLDKQNPNGIDKDKAANVFKECEIKYTEAIRLLDCEKLVVGGEYEPLISSLITNMILGVLFWNSTVSGGLEANVKETIEQIDKINQQSSQTLKAI